MVYLPALVSTLGKKEAYTGKGFIFAPSFCCWVHGSVCGAEGRVFSLSTSVWVDDILLKKSQLSSPNREEGVGQNNACCVSLPVTSFCLLLTR